METWKIFSCFFYKLTRNKIKWEVDEHKQCSFTSHLFTSRLRLVCWSNLTLTFALLCICYCFSHLIGLLSVTWLSLLYKFTRFFTYFLFLSDEGSMLETLDHTFRIGSTPTFLYFDLYLRLSTLCFINSLCSKNLTIMLKNIFLDH